MIGSFLKKVKEKQNYYLLTNQVLNRIMHMLTIQPRDVAQVVERYFREVEAASSSLVIPIVFKKEH